jgi:hypothetical protein
MSIRASEEAKHEGRLPVEEDTHKSEGTLQVSQQPIGEQQTMRHRRPLPEREVLRRLWRIYQMALAAADGTAETEQSGSE